MLAEQRHAARLSDFLAEVATMAPEGRAWKAQMDILLSEYEAPSPRDEAEQPGEEAHRMRRDIRTVQTKFAIFIYLISELSQTARRVIPSPVGRLLGDSYEDEIILLLRFDSSSDGDNPAIGPLLQMFAKDRAWLFALPSTNTLVKTLPGLTQRMMKSDEELVRTFGPDLHMTSDEYVRLIYAGCYEERLSPAEFAAQVECVLPKKHEEMEYLRQREAFDIGMKQYDGLLRRLANSGPEA